MEELEDASCSAASWNYCINQRLCLANVFTADSGYPGPGEGMLSFPTGGSVSAAAGAEGNSEALWAKGIKWIG